MQYKNYEIQLVEFGYIIRDSKGTFISCTENDKEAKDYIDSLIEDNVDIKEQPVDWYSRFEKYCSGLVGKCYPTSNSKKFGTIYKKALDRFVKSFENATNTKIIISTIMFEGETVYIVEDVIKEY